MYGRGRKARKESASEITFPQKSLRSPDLSHRLAYQPFSQPFRSDEQTLNSSLGIFHYADKKLSGGSGTNVGLDGNIYTSIFEDEARQTELAGVWFELSSGSMITTGEETLLFVNPYISAFASLLLSHLRVTLLMAQ